MTFLFVLAAFYRNKFKLLDVRSKQRGPKSLGTSHWGRFTNILYKLTFSPFKDWTSWICMSLIRKILQLENKVKRNVHFGKLSNYIITLWWFNENYYESVELRRKVENVGTIWPDMNNVEVGHTTCRSLAFGSFIEFVFMWLIFPWFKIDFVGGRP